MVLGETFVPKLRSVISVLGALTSIQVSACRFEKSLLGGCPRRRSFGVVRNRPCMAWESFPNMNLASFVRQCHPAAHSAVGPHARGSGMLLTGLMRQAFATQRSKTCFIALHLGHWLAHRDDAPSRVYRGTPPHAWGSGPRPDWLPRAPDLRLAK